MTTRREASRCRPIYGAQTKRAEELLKYIKNFGFQYRRYSSFRAPILRLSLGIPSRRDLDILDAWMHEDIRRTFVRVIKTIVDDVFVKEVKRIYAVVERISAAPLTEAERRKINAALFFEKFNELRAAMRR